MTEFPNIAQLPIFSNSVFDWALALAITSVAFLVLLTIRRAVRAYHKRMITTTETELQEIPMQVLSRTTLLLMLVVSLFIGSLWLLSGPKTGFRWRKSTDPRTSSTGSGRKSRRRPRS